MKPLLIASLLATAAAQAHVTLEQPEATAGSAYKAVLRVTHGCEGTATHTVTVDLPPGFRGAKPMAKAGWIITVRKERLAEPYDSHGRSVTEDAVQIVWKAASRDAWLADEQFDEFIVRGQTPPQPGAVWFKLRQQCEKGEWNWADLPAQGTSTRGLKAPAVRLDLLPAAAAGHQH